MSNVNNKSSTKLEFRAICFNETFIHKYLIVVTLNITVIRKFCEKVRNRFSFLSRKLIREDEFTNELTYCRIFIEENVLCK